MLTSVQVLGMLVIEFLEQNKDLYYCLIRQINKIEIVQVNMHYLYFYGTTMYHLFYPLLNIANINITKDTTTGTPIITP